MGVDHHIERHREIRDDLADPELEVRQIRRLIRILRAEVLLVIQPGIQSTVNGIGAAWL